jgi:hypothetical protein
MPKVIDVEMLPEAFTDFVDQLLVGNVLKSVSRAVKVGEI